MTKREVYSKMIEALEAGVVIEDVDTDFLVDFFQKEIDALDKKAIKAKEAAAKKKEAGDALRNEIEEILDKADGYLTIEQIKDEIGRDDITPAKITARLTQLIKADKVVRDKNKDKRTIYAIATLTAVPGDEAEVEETETSAE